MLACDHCGHMFGLPDRDHLRPMPDLKKFPSDTTPVAIVCPNCDRIHRITYPSGSGPSPPRLTSDTDWTHRRLALVACPLPPVRQPSAFGPSDTGRHRWALLMTAFETGSTPRFGESHRCSSLTAGLRLDTHR